MKKQPEQSLLVLSYSVALLKKNKWQVPTLKTGYSLSYGLELTFEI